ncbi:hypothetical protein LGQ02_12160 [Bacillus shivajii]|uniref:hypothetical protein n=1 Tax=Bacillus shivajii TaxID=1983719 RepID=UPI001CFA92B6|nr:hypothetical protein [Bacillus shivajii]UCZ51619.1 hypothetical protein LGQ02_12160 [Bacillus shivajii]
MRKLFILSIIILLLQVNLMINAFYYNIQIPSALEIILWGIAIIGGIVLGGANIIKIILKGEPLSFRLLIGYVISVLIIIFGGLLFFFITIGIFVTRM